MDTRYSTRSAPCSHCGDTVLVAEAMPLKVFGYRVGKGRGSRLEHADPSPGGEVYDGVDEDCRRARVR